MPETKPLPDQAELQAMLAQVVYRPGLSYTEGLDPLRNVLERDDGRVRRFLEVEWEGLGGKKRAAIGFALAEHFLKTGEVGALRALYAQDDPEVRESVLSALWGEPRSHPDMPACVVALAVAGLDDPSHLVRKEACYVLQNQAARKVDVSAAVGKLPALLRDPERQPRQMAAYATGNLAKAKYDMSACLPGLVELLGDETEWIRLAAAWALWQMSRRKHDIGAAVAGLVRVLVVGGENGALRKNAAGALASHARLSPENAAQVREALSGVDLSHAGKTAAHLLEQLDTR